MRRKSAVQIHWIRLSIITMKPKVTSSVLSGETEKRASSQCSATPKTKNAGAVTASVSSGSRPALASW